MDLNLLTSRLRGHVISAFMPADADALIWNGRKPKPQAKLIVRAACADDVALAVRFAADNGLTVSPRGGGHQFTGIAAKADMVIDLAALDGLKLDIDARTARVEPAVTNARMAAALERHGLGFPLGHCGSVPMSGYLLGGGVGWNSAEWGFACFSVTAAEVILADGRAITASAVEHPDIFWAVRGAGPEFFGIVVAYHLALKPAAKATTTTIRVYPADKVSDVAAWVETVMQKAPACVELTAKVTPTPSGAVIAVMATVFAATDALGQSIHDALGKGAPAALEVIGPMPTPVSALYEAIDASVKKGARYAVDTIWSDSRLGEVLTRVVHDMMLSPSEKSMALVVLRSNAVATPRDAAFSCHGRIFGAIYAIWHSVDEDAVNIGWLRTGIDRLSPISTGAYVGEADIERPDRVLPTLSPAALVRLASLQAIYDPRGLFRPAMPATAIAAE